MSGTLDSVENVVDITLAPVMRRGEKGSSQKKTERAEKGDAENSGPQGSAVTVWVKKI
jgi:hypothetical protein